MKASVLRRKALNAHGPRPARRYRVAPMFGNGDRFVIGRCQLQIGEAKLSRKRWLRGKSRMVNVTCGGQIVATRGRRKRKVYCEACRVRRIERQHAARQQRDLKPWLRTSRPAQAHTKFGRLFRRRTV